MRIFKNIKKNINWNSWPTKNRDEEIRKEIDKLAPPSGALDLCKVERTGTETPAMEKDFGFEEMTRAINMISRNSAPGKDGIEYIMIKKLPDIMKEELLRIFNKIWRSDTYQRTGEVIKYYL